MEKELFRDKLELFLADELGREYAELLDASEDWSNVDVSALPAETVDMLTTQSEKATKKAIEGYRSSLRHLELAALAMQGKDESQKAGGALSALVVAMHELLSKVESRCYEWNFLR